MTPTEQKIEQVALQGLSIVASIAGAVSGIALPGFLAAIPLVVKVLDEAKTVASVASAAGKDIPEAVAVLQALENLGIKGMDANDMAKLHADLEHQ